MKGKNTWLLLVVSLLFIFFLSVECFAASLKAGASLRKITPVVNSGKPVYLAGYDNNRTATGVHDDLYARCLVLSDGKNTIAFVALDLIGFFHSDVEKVREELKRKLPQVNYVVISSTHNHEGPDVLGLWGESPLKTGVDEEYLDFVRKQIVESIVEAANKMEPARMRFARDDRAELASLIRDTRLPIVKDWAVLGMRIETVDGKRAIATVVNWACHAEALGPNNTLITADFPGYLCRKIEEHSGGIVLFWNGAIGGLMTTAGGETYKNAEFIGNQVAEIIEDTFDKAPATTVHRLELKTVSLFVPMLNERFRLAASLGVLKRHLYTNGKVDTSTIVEQVPGLGTLSVLQGRDIRTEISVIRMGDAEIVTVPGELYPELANGGVTRYAGADFPDAPLEPIIRDHMKGQYKFLIGLGNDEIGYIIPKAEWDEKAPWLDNADHETYGEINSLGHETAPVLTNALVELLKSIGAGK